LAGTRPERMQRARTLSGRAETVVETTRNLIALEAEDAFLRWEEAETAARQAKEAADAADKLANDLSKDFAARQEARVAQVLNTAVPASQAPSQYYDFLPRQILALADLERVTAGGFCAGLVEVPVPPTPAGPATEQRHPTTIPLPIPDRAAKGTKS